MARTHSDESSQSFDRKIRSKVFKHVDLQLPEWFRSGCLPREHVTVLCLASRADEEHSELARHHQRSLVPVILFDQSKTQINSRRDHALCLRASRHLCEFR